MSHLYRLADGKPIRDAMHAAGMSGPEVADRTRELDPKGRGVSPAAVGRVSGQGETAQDRTRERTGWLIALALGVPVQDLFTPECLRMPTDSTVTVERSRYGAEERPA